MTAIYLKHPVHGTKVATMDAEANADVANGWRVYNPVNHVTEVEEVEVISKEDQVLGEEAEVAPPVEVKRRRKV